MKKSRLRSEKVFHHLEQMASSSENEGAKFALDNPAGDGDENTSQIQAVKGRQVEEVPDSSRLPRMKKFRFQLLHQWLIHSLPPCKTADVGGGKGLLSYLLVKSGWDVTIIDPNWQPLPEKYKDIGTGKRVKLTLGESIPWIKAGFSVEQAAGFDLLIGMHAHGCNAKIIDAAAAYGCGFVIFPCCVIDEPFYPPLGVHWLESLADYALKQGLKIQPFRLNFKGQNIGLYSALKDPLVL